MLTQFCNLKLYLQQITCFLFKIILGRCIMQQFVLKGELILVMLGGFRTNTNLGGENLSNDIDANVFMAYNTHDVNKAI